MTPDRSRELALRLPEVSESQHMNHPDFRVVGKVFASLFPGELWSVIKLTSELQAELLQKQPDVFEPCKGARGAGGATIVFLDTADEGRVLRALIDALRKHAPEKMVEDFDDQND